MKKLALFASGNGTNVQQIAEYFKSNPHVEISLVLTNNPKARVLNRAKNLGLPSLIFSREDLYNSSKILNILKEKNIDLIVLAGFLWLIPNNLIRAYIDKIINIHPALLPEYGGKGMYGHHVHEAVIKNKEKKSGITIHYVNEKYDDGQIIFQATVEIDKQDTPGSLAEKIHLLEKKYFPKVIEEVLFG